MSDASNSPVSTAQPGNPPRRMVMKGAAWSLPVFAATAVSPLAAASAAQAIVSTLGSAVATPSTVANGGSVNVGFWSAGLRIIGIVGPPWDAGVFTADLSLVARYAITGVTIGGVPVTSTGGSYVSPSGQVWTVVAIDLADNIFVLETHSAITVDATNGASQDFFIPSIVFSGTYTGNSVNSGRVIMDVSAANVSGGAIPGVRFGA